MARIGRAWTRMLLVAIAGLAVGSSGCTLAGPSASPDAGADASVAPDGRTLAPANLFVFSIRPEPTQISDRPAIRIQFSDYLEDESFKTYNAVQLVSGGVTVGGRTDYRMTDRALVWRPGVSLPEGIQFQLQLSGSIRSVLGDRLAVRKELKTYRPSEEREPPSFGENGVPDSPTWKNVDRIFEAECRTCHGAKKWGRLDPLTHESLVGEPSNQVDRMLVRPYDAPDSYLMHKLLWDYPSRRGSPQPPPWSDGGEELSDVQLHTIERWIDQGAVK